jgi:hypothetical protein
MSTAAQSVYDVTKTENKFVYGNSIKLFLGDKIFVEATQEGKIFKDFKMVDVITDSSKTIIIEFKYDNFGSEKASLLRVSNPFENILNYKAKIKPISKSKYSETSIEPVFPKIFSMEMWPYKIESIILSDFKIGN